MKNSKCTANQAHNEQNCELDTRVPVRASASETLQNQPVETPVRADHVSPPSVVRRTSPPTAIPLFSSMNGTDHHGNDVASGVYFYRMEALGFSDTKKFTLLK